MRQVCPLLCLLCAGFLASQPVYAGWELSSPGDPSRYWRIGLLANAGYTDNFDTGSTNKQSSLTATFEPKLSLNLPMEQTSISLQYTYSATYYLDLPGNQVNESHIFDLSVIHTFNPRLRLSITDNLRRGIEPELVDITTGVPLITRRRGDYFYNNLGGGLDFSLTRRWTMSVHGDWTYWRYDDPVSANSNDRDEYGATVSASYGVDPRTFIALNYRYGAVDYIQPGPGSSRNFFSNTAFLSLVRRFTTQFSLQLYGGMGLTEFGDGTKQTSPYAGGSVSYNYGPASAATAGFTYSLSSTEVNAFRSSDTASLYANVHHRITARLAADFGASYVIYSYQNPSAGSAFANTSPTETAIGLSAGFYYELTPAVIVETKYTFDEVSSDIPGRSFDRNQASIGLHITY